MVRLCQRRTRGRHAALERHVRRVCGGAAQLAGARDRARRAFEWAAAGRVLRARHRLAEGRRHARKRLPRRERAHPGRPHGRDAQAPGRRARRHRRDPPRARALLRGARPGAEGEIRGDELGGSARSPDYESGGQEFESLRPRQIVLRFQFIA